MFGFAVKPVLMHSLCMARGIIWLHIQRELSTHGTTLVFFLWGHFQSCVCVSDLDLEATSDPQDTIELKEVHYSNVECASLFWSPRKQSKYSFILPSFASAACYCNLSISIIWMTINWWNSGVLTAQNINFSLHVIVMHMSSRSLN